MKNKNLYKLTAAAIIYFLFSIGEAESKEPWEGKFAWNNAADTSKYGNVQQNAGIEIVLTSAQEITVSCLILWKEGTLVEFGNTAPVTSISSHFKDGILESYTIHFDFIDSHENNGVCDITIIGNKAILSASISKIEDKRAARQYGEYHLLRETPLN